MTEISPDRPSTFHTPSAPTRAAPRFMGSNDTRGAHALTRQLEKISPGLRALNRTMIDAYVGDQRAKGEAWALENQDKYREAVRSGDLPAGGSVFFQQGVAREGLRQEAEAFELEMVRKYQTSGELQSMSPDNFSAYLEARSAEFLKGLPGDDSFKAPVVAPFLRSINRRLTEQHIAESISRTEQRGKDQLFTGTQSAIDRIRSFDDYSVGEEAQALGVSMDGVGSIEELRTQTMAAAIEAQADVLYDNGMRGKEINAILVDAITSKAVAEGNLGLLDLMDEIAVGPGQLGSTRYATEQRIKAEGAIAAKQERAEDEWWQDYQRGRVVASNEAWTQLYGALNAGDQQATDVALEVIRQVDPGGYNKATNAVTAYRNPTTSSDPGVVHEVERDLALGYEVTQSELDTMLANGELSRDDHIRFTEDRQSQDKQRRDYAEGVASHARRIFEPSNDLLVSLPDGRARQGEAQAEAAVMANRWHRDFVQQHGRQPSFEDQLKGQALIVQQLQADPRFAPLLQEPGFKAQEAPQTAAETPEDNPPGTMLSRAWDALTSPSTPAEPERPMIPGAAAEALVTAYNAATSAEEAQTILDEFDAIFGPGSAATFILRDE